MKYTFPNAATLTAIGRELILDLNTANPIFDFLFPIQERNAIKVQWYQDKNERGLMKLRGAGGAPTRVNPVGRDYFETEPGVFGEYISIDEIELLELGQGIPKNNLAIALSVDERILQHQRTLSVRYYNRLRQMAWTMARTGNLQIQLPSGGIGYMEAVTVQNRVISTLWSNRAAATPLQDLQAQQQLYGIGTSYDYNYNSVSIMNTWTKNLLFNNINPNDWGGKKGAMGSSIQGMGAYDVIRTDMELPQIITWDKGCIGDDGVWRMDCPNGEVLHVGTREDGEKAGEFMLTHNAQNESPKPYSEVHDYTGNRGGSHDKEIPPRLEVHMGFNGGIAVHHAQAWTRLIVA